MYSGSLNAIFSASITFFHKDAIKNIRKLILEDYRLNGVCGVTWVFGEAYDSGTREVSGRWLKQSSVFKSDRGEKSVLFKESLDHELFVEVNGVEVLRVQDGQRLAFADYAAIVDSLEA